VRPRRTITAVENAFSTSFCAEPAFSRVEPEIASGDGNLDDEVGAARQLRADDRHDRSAQRPGGRRRLERAERVRRAPARRHRYDDVLGARA